MGNWNNSRFTFSNESSSIIHDCIFMKKTIICDECSSPSGELFRCRYNYKKKWMFLCKVCLAEIKTKYSNTYQYGGTKKNKNN